MDTIIINTHNCSEEEFEQLREYLDEQHWDYSQVGTRNNLDLVKYSFATAIDLLRSLLEKNVPQKGDKSEDCQKLCIQNALSELEATVTGLEKEDLIPSEDYQFRNN